MKVRLNVTDAATLIAAACALALTGLVARRELFGRSPARGQAVALLPTRMAPAQWEQYVDLGHRMGPADARVVILEFGDFECPACAAFYTELKHLDERYPGAIAVVFRQFPLSYHHLAYPMAVAAECAASQGRFEAFFRTAYEKHDSLGLISLEDFGRRAHVADQAEFAACAKRPGKDPTIERDIAAARALQTRGTPTVAINGLVYHSNPNGKTLDSLVRAVLRASP